MHIIICGRNEAAATEIISSLPKHANSKYEFVQCDASRLANVSAACKELKEERGLTKLNYLFTRRVSETPPPFDALRINPHADGDVLVVPATFPSSIPGLTMEKASTAK